MSSTTQYEHETDAHAEVAFFGTPYELDASELPAVTYMTRAQAAASHAPVYVAAPRGRGRRPKHEPQPSHGS